MPRLPALSMSVKMFTLQMPRLTASRKSRSLKPLPPWRTSGSPVEAEMARKALKKAHAKKRRPIPARPRFAGGEYGHVIPNIPYGGCSI